MNPLSGVIWGNRWRCWYKIFDLHMREKEDPVRKALLLEVSEDKIEPNI